MIRNRELSGNQRVISVLCASVVFDLLFIVSLIVGVMGLLLVLLCSTYAASFLVLLSS